MSKTPNLPLNDQQTGQLRALILAELAHARLLHHRLTDELTLLRHPNAEALQAAARRKSASLQHLSQLANERLQWLNEHQLPLAEAFLQHPTIQHHADIRSLWQQLAAWYERNRTMSARLSDIVLRNRRRVQQRLEILRGKKQQSTILYNKQGQSQLGGTGGGYISA